MFWPQMLISGVGLLLPIFFKSLYRFVFEINIKFAISEYDCVTEIKFIGSFRLNYIIQLINCRLL